MKIVQFSVFTSVLIRLLSSKGNEASFFRWSAETWNLDILACLLLEFFRAVTTHWPSICFIEHLCSQREYSEESSVSPLMGPILSHSPSSTIQLDSLVLSVSIHSFILSIQTRIQGVADLTHLLVSYFDIILAIIFVHLFNPKFSFNGVHYFFLLYLKIQK